MTFVILIISFISIIITSIARADVVSFYNIEHNDKSVYMLITITPNDKVKAYDPRRVSHDLLTEKLLREAQEWYLQQHVDRGSLGSKGDEKMLESFQVGPERFLDGRSSYVMVVEASEKDLFSEDFNIKSAIKGMLRIAKYNYLNPLLPLQIRLKNHLSDNSIRVSEPKLDQPILDRLSPINIPRHNNHIAFYGIPSNREPKIAPSGDAVELKAFGIQSNNRIDFIPYMLWAAEAFKITTYGGRLTRADGFYWNSGDPIYKKVTWPLKKTLVTDYFVEYDVSQRIGGQSLKRYYNLLGFNEIMEIQSPDIPNNKTIVAHLNRNEWLDLIDKVSQRYQNSDRNGINFIRETKIIKISEVKVKKLEQRLSQTLCRKLFF